MSCAIIQVFFLFFCKYCCFKEADGAYCIELLPNKAKCLVHDVDSDVLMFVHDVDCLDCVDVLCDKERTDFKYCRDKKGSTIKEIVHDESKQPPPPAHTQKHT